MTNQAKATIFALATVFIWSTMASALKLSLRLLTVSELLFYSSLCSVLVFGLVIAVQGRLRTLVSLRPGYNMFCWTGISQSLCLLFCPASGL